MLTGIIAYALLAHGFAYAQRGTTTRSPTGGSGARTGGGGDALVFLLGGIAVVGLMSGCFALALAGLCKLFGKQVSGGICFLISIPIAIAVTWFSWGTVGILISWFGVGIYVIFMLFFLGFFVVLLVHPESPFSWLLGLVVSLWGIWWAARISLATLATFVSSSAPADFLESILLCAAAGLFAGIAVAVMRAYPRKPGHFHESFVSALFNKGLGGELDRLFWARTMVGGIVGVLVGAFTGASGALSFLQLGPELTAGLLSRSQSYALVAAFGAGGGSGGSTFTGVLWILVVVLVLAVLSGVLAGLVLQVALLIVGGAAKGATKAWTLEVLRDKPAAQASWREIKAGPIVSGALRGGLVGLLVGAIEGIVTSLGFLHS